MQGRRNVSILDSRGDIGGSRCRRVDTEGFCSTKNCYSLGDKMHQSATPGLRVLRDFGSIGNS